MPHHAGLLDVLRRFLVSLKAIAWPVLLMCPLCLSPGFYRKGAFQRSWPELVRYWGWTVALKELEKEYSHLICTLTMTQRLATPMENASMENFCSTWCSLESLRLIEFDVGGLSRCSEFCKFDINYFRDFLFIYLVKQSQLSITILRTQFNNSLPDDFIRLKPMDYWQFC